MNVLSQNEIEYGLMNIEGEQFKEIQTTTSKNKVLENERDKKTGCFSCMRGRKKWKTGEDQQHGASIF